jgi:hypothetical protein
VPAEPIDGAVIRFVRDHDGAVLLAERDDWPIGDPPSDVALLRETGFLDEDGRRHWYVHDIACLGDPPLTWQELVDQADRLIVFVPATLATPATPAIARPHPPAAAGRAPLTVWDEAGDWT